MEKKTTAMQALKFVLFSISAGLVQVLVDLFFNEVVHLKPHYSYLIALICSVLYNFTINRKFTFKGTSNVPIAMIKVALFYCVFTPLSTWWTKEFTDMGTNEYIILLGTMLTNMITEFLYCKFVVYRKDEKIRKMKEKMIAEGYVALEKPVDEEKVDTENIDTHVE